MLFVGIDLAGSEKRRTGICFLDEEKNCWVKLVNTNDEILEEVRKASDKIRYVGIDAPLSLPAGRKDISSSGPHFRKCDLELRKLGIRFFPVSLGPMRMLLKRGLDLKKAIQTMRQDLIVVEVFPGALYDVFGIPRKSKDKIASFFKSRGIKMEDLSSELTQDELDSIACAYTVYLFHFKKAREIGDKKEGTIVIPIKESREYDKRSQEKKSER